MSEQQHTGFTIGANINPFEQAMRGMVAASQNAQGQIAGVFKSLNGVLVTAMAALSGGAAMKASIDATQKFTGEANKLARVLGATATEASALNVALGDIYTDADTFTGAASKLAKELRTNESALNDMGLKTRDASGNLRPLKDLMMDSIGVVNSYKQGIDRNIAAQQLWGKSADEVSVLLKLNNQVLDEAKRKQQELGLIVGQENVEASRAYKAAMNDVGDVLLAAQKAAGDALMPVLTRLAEMFSSIGPSAVFVFRTAINSLATALHAIVLMFQVVWEAVRALADPLFTLGSAIRKLISGDMTGASMDMQNIFSSWGKQLSGVWDRIKSDSARTWKDVQALWSQPTAAAGPATGGRSATGIVKTGKGSEDSLMAKWSAELAAMKEAHAQQNAEQGTFYEFGKERELEFWRAKQAIVQAGTKDAYAVQVKLTASTLDVQKEAFEATLAGLQREQAAAEQNYTLKLELARKEQALIEQRYGAESKQAIDAAKKIEEVERAARDQRQQLRQIELAEINTYNTTRIELERQRVQFEQELGVLSRAEAIAAEQVFEQQKYELQLAALQQRQALLDPDKNPVEYARIKQEILQLEQQHLLAVQQLRDQAALEDTARARSALQSMESGWASLFKGIGTQVKTVGDLIRGIFKVAMDTVISTLAQMAAKWMAQQIAMKLFGKTMALGKIAEESAKAGAGGVASMAAAPFPLNLDAPAFGAAMAALAMSYAPLASAAGGFDIPAGLNPLTQLHEEEMVLPAHLANPLREQLAGGGAGGAGKGDTYIIQAMDSRSFEQFARDNAPAFSQAVKTAARRGF
jgi:hypothetical protein